MKRLMLYKLMHAMLMVVLPLALVMGCTSAGERAESKAAPEAGNKVAAKKSEISKTTPASKVKGKPALSAKSEASPTESGVGAAKTEPAVTTAARPASGKSSIYLGSDGKMAGIGDPSKPVSEAYKIGMSARPAALAGAGLPKDKFGLIDWVAVVKKGEIKPIGSLDPGKPDIPPFDMDIVIEAKGDFVNNVLFPHSDHTYWLSCENCHPAIFAMGKGKNKMSMVEISEGKWCGRCHGKVAFPLTDCSRCHTKQKG